MRGIEFQQGGYEQEHHPLVVEIGDICLLIGEPMTEKCIHGIDHRNARQHEEDVGDILHSLEAMNHQRIALVELHRLYQGKENGAQQEYPAGVKQHGWINESKSKAACTDNHQHAAEQENCTLYLS